MLLYGREAGRERKPNRCPEINYSNPGCYFLTICTKDRINYFGEVKNGKMILNKYGAIIQRQWYWMGEQYSYVRLDAFIIMPNHFHGILIIDNYVETTGVETTGVETTLGLSLHNYQLSAARSKYFRQKNVLSKTICAFKTTSSKMIHNVGLLEFQWQRSFYDRLIRDENGLNAVRWYIQQNPEKWWRDRNNW